LRFVEEVDGPSRLVDAVKEMQIEMAGMPATQPQPRAHTSVPATATIPCQLPSSSTHAADAAAEVVETAEDILQR
jgi:hypothetical protein